MRLETLILGQSDIASVRWQGGGLPSYVLAHPKGLLFGDVIGVFVLEGGIKDGISICRNKNGETEVLCIHPGGIRSSHKSSKMRIVASA